MEIHIFVVLECKQFYKIRQQIIRFYFAIDSGSWFQHSLCPASQFQNPHAPECSKSGWQFTLLAFVISHQLHGSWDNAAWILGDQSSHWLHWNVDLDEWFSWWGDDYNQDWTVLIVIHVLCEWCNQLMMVMMIIDSKDWTEVNDSAGSDHNENWFVLNPNI